MTDLSTIDQTPNQSPPVSDNSSRSRAAAPADIFPMAPNMQYGTLAGGVRPQHEDIRFRHEDSDQTALERALPGSTPMGPTLVCRRKAADTRQIMAKLARVRVRKEQDRKDGEALHWLAENRSKYAGLWVALQGSQLLASGRTAKEVYSQILGQQPPPLVTRVESDNLPFGGW